MDDQVSDEEEGDAVIDLRGELYAVQRQLDRIATTRLQHYLTADENRAYQLLARREVELILELADDPLGPRPQSGSSDDRVDSGGSDISCS